LLKENAMPTTLKTIAILCGSGLLLGCAANSKSPSLTLVPYSAVRHGDESALGYYTLGRYFHGARRLDQALQAYQQALALQPQDPRTRNALATLYAERGEYRKAIPLLRELAESSTDASHLYSNLGYAYYLNGEYGEAVAALEKATRLDPLNQRAANNLAAAQTKLGKAGASNKLAAASRHEPLPVSPPIPLVQHPPAATPALPTAATPKPNAVAEIRQVGPYSYEIGNAPKTVATPAASSPPQPLAAAPAGKPFRLVIANGNGIPGLAKKVSQALATADMPAPRLVNLKPYQQAQTMIQYRNGYRDQALQLSRELLREPKLVLTANLHRSADVQLTLGKDKISAMALFGPESARAKLAKKAMPLTDQRS
jgi:tetratricopeptide (TPR) repeat protein